jgi:hypothetical protein
MANTQKQKPVARTDRGVKSKKASKKKDIESEKPEQETPIESSTGEWSSERPTKKEEALAKEREDYRHGGIPIGSDPRE